LLDSEVLESCDPPVTELLGVCPVDIPLQLGVHLHGVTRKELPFEARQLGSPIHNTRTAKVALPGVNRTGEALMPSWLPLVHATMPEDHSSTLCLASAGLPAAPPQDWHKADATIESLGPKLYTSHALKFEAKRMKPLMSLGQGPQDDPAANWSF
jgi:hypothetical protein